MSNAIRKPVLKNYFQKSKRSSIYVFCHVLYVLCHVYMCSVMYICVLSCIVCVLPCIYVFGYRFCLCFYDWMKEFWTMWYIFVFHLIISDINGLFKSNCMYQ
jgi:hypothetical protein